MNSRLQDKGWQSMMQLLDKELPVGTKSDRTKRYLVAACLALFLLGTGSIVGYYVGNHGNSRIQYAANKPAGSPNDNGMVYNNHAGSDAALKNADYNTYTQESATQESAQSEETNVTTRTHTSGVENGTTFLDAKTTAYQAKSGSGNGYAHSSHRFSATHKNGTTGSFCNAGSGQIALNRNKLSGKGIASDLYLTTNTSDNTKAGLSGSVNPAAKYIISDPGSSSPMLAAAELIESQKPARLAINNAFSLPAERVKIETSKAITKSGKPLDMTFHLSGLSETFNTINGGSVGVRKNIRILGSLGLETGVSYTLVNKGSRFYNNSFESYSKSNNSGDAGYLWNQTEFTNSIAYERVAANTPDNGSRWFHMINLPINLKLKMFKWLNVKAGIQPTLALYNEGNLYSTDKISTSTLDYSLNFHVISGIEIFPTKKFGIELCYDHGLNNLINNPSLSETRLSNSYVKAGLLYRL